MLNLLDGTSTPKLHNENWTGVKLVDEEPNADTEIFNDTLPNKRSIPEKIAHLL
jgi:hypothetical protein